MQFRPRPQGEEQTHPFVGSPSPVTVTPPTQPTTQPSSTAQPTTLPTPAPQPSPAATMAVFGGLYDSPAPTTSPPRPGDPAPPSTTLFTGITEANGEAHDHATHLNGNPNAFAAYDGTNVTQKPSGPANGSTGDMLSDAAAVLIYSQMGNLQTMGIDLPSQFGFTLPGGEKYLSPQQLAQQGSQAVLKGENAPQNPGDPIVLDAHSGGGQPAYYTAMQLAEQGYTNVTIVGFDMAMTPQQRKALEASGVDVNNSTSHIGTDQNYINSPVGALIQMAMGGGPNYYDQNIANNPAYAADPTAWHGFDNGTVLPYLQQQNQQAVQGQQPGPATGHSDQLYLPVGQILSPGMPILNNFYTVIDPNANAQANINLNNGSASNSINLSGTTIDTPFTHNTLGDWAQASSSVDLSHGAASVNVGGDKGVGADVNLSQGQIDLNWHGQHIDVDQAIHNTARTAATTARNVANTAGNVVHKAVDTAGNVVHKVSDTASNVVHKAVDTAGNVVHQVSDTASNVVHKAVDTAGNVVHKVADTASNVAHNVSNTASNVVHKAVDTAGNVVHKVSDTASNVAHNVSNTASNVVHQAVDTASHVAHNVSNTASNVAHSVSNTVSSGVQSAQHAAQGVFNWLTGKKK